MPGDYNHVTSDCARDSNVHKGIELIKQSGARRQKLFQPLHLRLAHPALS